MTARHFLKPALLGAAMVLALGLRTEAETRDYDPGDFTAVEVHDGVSAAIAEGGRVAVRAEARRGDLDRLTVERRGDTLHLGRHAEWGLFGAGKRDRFHVEIALPELSRVLAASGSAVEVAAAGPGLEARATSGASLRVTGLDGGAVTASAASGASVWLAGRCDRLEASAASGASLRARDLRCDEGTLRATGGASLAANLGRTASAEAASGASIRLSGGARLTASHVSGGASIRQD